MYELRAVIGESWHLLQLRTEGELRGALLAWMACMPDPPPRIEFEQRVGEVVRDKPGEFREVLAGSVRFTGAGACWLKAEVLWCAGWDEAVLPDEGRQDSEDTTYLLVRFNSRSGEDSSEVRIGSDECLAVMILPVAGLQQILDFARKKGREKVEIRARQFYMGGIPGWCEVTLRALV